MESINFVGFRDILGPLIAAATGIIRTNHAMPPGEGWGQRCSPESVTKRLEFGYQEEALLKP